MKKPILSFLLFLCVIFPGLGQRIEFPKGFSDRFLYIYESSPEWNWCFGESGDSLLSPAIDWSSFIIKDDGSTWSAKSLWGPEFSGQISPVFGEYQGFRYFTVQNKRLYKVDKALRAELVPTPEIDLSYKFSNRERFIFRGYLFYPDEAGFRLIHLDSLSGNSRPFKLPGARFISLGDSLFFGFQGSKFSFFDRFFQPVKPNQPVSIPINWRNQERIVYEPDSLERPFSYQKTDSNGTWQRIGQGALIWDNDNSIGIRLPNNTLTLGLEQDRFVRNHPYRFKNLVYGFRSIYPGWSHFGEFQNRFYRQDLLTDSLVFWPLPGSASLKSAEMVWHNNGRIFASITSEKEGREQLFRFHPETGKWDQVTQFDFERYAHLEDVHFLGSKLVVYARSFGTSNKNVFLLDTQSVVVPQPSRYWSRVLSPPVADNPLWPNGGPAILMGMDVSKKGEILTLHQVSNFSDLFWQGTGLDSLRIRKNTIAPAPNFAFGGQLITLFDSKKNIKWTRTISGYYYERRSAIKFTPQGKIAVVGYNFPLTAIDSIRIYSTWNTASYAAQFDSSGKTEWVLPIYATHSCEASELTVDDAGNLFFVLMVKGRSSIGNLSFGSTRFNKAFYLVKVSPNGNPVWAKELNVQNGFTWVQSSRIVFNPHYKQVNVMLQELCRGCFGYEKDSTTQCRVFGYNATDGEKRWEKTISSFEAGLVINSLKISEKGALHLVGAGAGTLKIDDRTVLEFREPKLSIQPFWLRMNPYGGWNETKAIELPSLYPWDLSVDKNEGVVVVGTYDGTNEISRKYLYLDQDGQVLEEVKFSEPNSSDNLHFFCNPHIFISENKEIVLGDYFRFGYSGIPYRFSSWFNKGILFGFPFETKTQTYSFTGSKERFRVFPNPSSGGARLFLNYLEFDKMEVAVFNLEGKKVYSTQLAYQKEDFYSLPLEALPTGIYFIKINSSNPFSTIKWVKF